MAGPFDDPFAHIPSSEPEPAPAASAPEADPWGANPFATATPGFTTAKPEVPHDEGIGGITSGAIKRGFYGAGVNLEGGRADLARRQLAHIDRIERQRKAAGLELSEAAARYREQLRAEIPKFEGTATALDAKRAETRAPAAVEELSKAKGFWDSWNAFWKDPIKITYAQGLESLIAQAPALPAAAGAYAVAGVPGAAGVMGAYSGNMEYISTIREALAEEGVDVLDANAVSAAMADPARAARIRDRAVVKAGIVGSLDAASVGVASRVLPGIRNISNPVARHAANIPAQTAVQGILGGTGEGLGTVASGEEFKWGPVIAEAAGEAFGAPGEVLALRNARRMSTTDNPSPTEQFNAAQPTPADPFAHIPSSEPTASPTEAPVAPAPVEGPVVETPPVSESVAPARDVDGLGYYSAALEAAKEWKQPRGTPQQAIKYLKSKGVKDAEIESTGLDAFLADKKSVTRDELAGFLEQNRTRLSEASYGGTKADWDIFEGDNFHDNPERRGSLEDKPKFPTYSLEPTNPTYVERVVHLPGQDIDALGSESDRLQEALRNARSAEEAEAVGRQVTALRERVKSAEGDFQSGHFPQPNIVGHYQASQQQDSAGKKVFTLSQIQSDWGQARRNPNEGQDASELRQMLEIARKHEAEMRSAVEASPRDRDVARGLEIAAASVRRIDAELQTAMADRTVAHPLVNTTDQWSNTILRRMIKDASDSGAKYIAIPSGQTVLSYNPGKESGMEEFYDKIVPKNLMNLLRKMDPSVKPTKTATLKSNDGSKDLGKGFTVFPITDKVREAVRGGQPMFAKTMNATVYDQVAKGKPWVVLPNVRKEVLKASTDLSAMFPADTYVAAVKKIVRSPDDKADAILTIVDRHGEEREVVAPISNLRGSLAWFEDLAVDGPTIVSFRFDLSGDFVQSIRGELAHEGVHALWHRLPADVRSALVSHGDSIGVLNTDLRVSLRRGGYPAENAETGVSLFEIYHRKYAEYDNYRDAMQQEIAANMMQWYAAGGLSSEQAAPVKAILDDILAGVYSGNYQESRQEGIAAAAGPMSAITDRSATADNEGSGTAMVRPGSIEKATRHTPAGPWTTAGLRGENANESTTPIAQRVLDLGKPLGQQTPYVQKALQQAARDLRIDPEMGIDPEMTGAELLSMSSDRKSIESALQKAGIVGTRTAGASIRRFDVSSDPMFALSGDEKSAVAEKKKRAQKQGFDTSKVWYRGMGQPANGMEPRSGAYSKFPAVWFSSSPEVASEFAAADTAAHFSYTSGDKSQPNVTPAYLRTKNMKTVNNFYRGADFAKMDKVMEKAKADGYDGVIFKNIHDRPSLQHARFGGFSPSKSTTSVAVFDSANIRSVNAAFDPAKADRSGIMFALSGDGGQRPQSALSVIKSFKGIRDPQGELRAILGRPSRGTKAKGNQQGYLVGVINNQTGVPLDRAREILIEKGFLPQDADLNSLYNMLERMASGERVVAIHDQDAEDAYNSRKQEAADREEVLNTVNSYFEEHGLPNDLSPQEEARVFELAREGVRVDDAIERIFLEDKDGRRDEGIEAQEARSADALESDQIPEGQPGPQEVGGPSQDAPVDGTGSGQGTGRDLVPRPAPPPVPAGDQLSPAAINYMRSGNEGGGGRGGPPRDGDVTPPGDGDGPRGIPDSPRIDAEANRSFTDRMKSWFNTISNWYTPTNAIPNTDDYLIKRYRALGKKDDASRASAAIWKRFSKATDADKKASYAYLTTRDADPFTISDPDVREAAIYSKQVIDWMGQALVDRGMITEASYQQYRSEYLPRLYLKHIIKNGRIVDAMAGGMRPSTMGYTKKRNTELDSEARAILGEITDPGFLASRGVFRPMRDIAMIDFLNQISENDQWVFRDGLVNFNGKMASPYYLRSEANELRDRAAIMERDNPDSARKMLEQAAMMDAVASTVIGREENVPDGYSQVPDTPRYGLLRGMYLRKEIKNDILPAFQIVPEDASSIAKLMRPGGVMQKAVSYWKAAKVPMNPSSQFRNVFGNKILMTLAGMTPMDIRKYRKQAEQEMAAPKLQAARWVTGRDPLPEGPQYRFARSMGLDASGFSESELTKLNREFVRAEHALARSKPWGKTRLAGVLLRQGADAATEKAGNVQQYYEKKSKLALMLWAQDKLGMSPEMAYLEAQKWLFDYSLLPNTIKHIRNSPLLMPFVTFQYKVLPRIIDSAVKSRGVTLAPYIALPYALATLFATTWGVDDDDVEKMKKALPEYMRKKGNATIIPWKDSNGNWQFFDYGYLLPWSMFQEAGSAIADGDFNELRKQVGIFGAPGADIISAIKTGVDPFTGRPIMDPKGTPEEKIGSMMAYVWRMAMPSWMTDQSFLKKMNDAYKGTPDYFGDPSLTMSQAMLRGVGLNVYPVDPETSRGREIRKMQREIQDLKSGMRSRLKDERLNDAQRDKISSDYERYIAKKEAAMERYDKESDVNPKLYKGATPKKKEVDPFAHIPSR